MESVHEPLGIHDQGDRPKRRRIHLRRFAGHSRYLGHYDEPLRIAHLTDQHVGRVTPLAVQMEAVAVANAEAPDLVTLTGDFVCHSQEYLEELGCVIRAFNAPVVCVLGNHDHWSGADEVRRTLTHAGALVLDNAHTVIQVRHTQLQVVGLDDAYTGHADVGRAVKGLNPLLPTLGLSHIAEEADRLWHHGVPLVLSGHTHGGQITLARLHELALGRIAGHRYVHGLYGARKGEHGAVYVGAGIGAGVMPLRLGDRGQREVTIFELGAEVGRFDEHHGEQLALPGRKPSPKTQAKRQAAVVKKRAARDRRNGTVPSP